RSDASMVCFALLVTLPSAAILPFATATSARWRGEPRSSTTVPFLINKSYDIWRFSFFLCGCLRKDTPCSHCLQILQIRTHTDGPVRITCLVPRRRIPNTTIVHLIHRQILGVAIDRAVARGAVHTGNAD